MSLTPILSGQFVPAGGGYSLRLNHNHDVAENTAILYSLLVCCAETDVNPKKWLTQVIIRIPYYKNDYSLDMAYLLPNYLKGACILQKTLL